MVTMIFVFALPLVFRIVLGKMEYKHKKIQINSIVSVGKNKMTENKSTS